MPKMPTLTPPNSRTTKGGVSAKVRVGRLSMTFAPAT